MGQRVGKAVPQWGNARPDCWTPQGGEQGRCRTPIAGKSGRACLGKPQPRPGGVKSVQWTDLRVEPARKPSRPGLRGCSACGGLPVCLAVMRDRRRQSVGKIGRAKGRPAPTVVVPFGVAPIRQYILETERSRANMPEPTGRLNPLGHRLLLRSRRVLRALLYTWPFAGKTVSRDRIR